MREFDANKVRDAITAWIASYFRDNATPKTLAVVGISGGKDSSVAAALCKEALGAQRVLGVLMPQGAQHDIGSSYEVCRLLAIPFIEINIKDAVDALLGAIESPKSRITLNAAAKINTPARIRMATLYAVSAATGGRVVNTCNLSEDYVGYSTKFGDSAGDFSPLSDLTVTEVKAVGRSLGLPPSLIEKVPEDGLSGKSDEDNLGFSYDVLDKYIRQGVCHDATVKQRIDSLRNANLHKLMPMPSFRLDGSV